MAQKRQDNAQKYFSHGKYLKYESLKIKLSTKNLAHFQSEPHKKE